MNGTIGMNETVIVVKPYGYVIADSILESIFSLMFAYPVCSAVIAVIAIVSCFIIYKASNSR